jgi:cytosine/adenosine deaminase-related metal-dependent hydrolase
MPTLLLKNIHTLVTMDAARRELQNGALFIRDGIIEAVGALDEMPAQTADEVLDLRRHVVMPGMINTHHHMVQSLTRVIAQDNELFDWLTTLYPIWSGLT